MLSKEQINEIAEVDSLVFETKWYKKSWEVIGIPYCPKARGGRCISRCREPCRLAGGYIEELVNLAWEEYARGN